MRALVLPIALLCGCTATDGELLRIEPFANPDAGLLDMSLVDAGSSAIQLCGCGDVLVQQALEVDGDLAVRGRLGASGGLTVDGTLYSEADPLGTNAPITVGGLRQAAGIQHGSDLTVLGDAHVGGDVAVLGILEVGGTIFLADDRRLQSGDDETHRRQAPVDAFVWPCDCAADSALADAVEAPEPDERPALGLTAESLANLQSDLELTLTAGRYVFDAIGGPGALRVRIEGAVEWVIPGDVQVDGGLDIALAEGATLRLLIGGTLTVGGPTAMGDPDRPDALEVHVLTGPSIAISEAFALAGHLRAPASELGTSVPLDWTGSVVVRRVSAAAGLRLRR